MQLTQKQEWLVARYLREVGNALGDVSDAVREQALGRIDARIHRKLNGLVSRNAQVRDEDVQRVLRELGAPAAQAAEAVEGLRTPGACVLAPDDRKWLGVCGGLARYLGVEARWVRAAFLLLGVTGPIILIIYLGLYVEMYVHSDPAGVPRVDKGRLIKHVLAAVGAIISLHVGAQLLVWGALEAHNRISGLAPLSGLGRWDWLRVNASFFLFCAIVNLAPLSALSGLPLANRWDQTLTRVTQAGVVLYGFLLSFGVAVFLTGLILAVARQLGA